jgi:hypothetical protein
MKKLFFHFLSNIKSSKYTILALKMAKQIININPSLSCSNLESDTEGLVLL